MTLSLDILAARMRQGESIPLGDTARVAVALSVPAILQQLVVTAMEYIDAAMVGHIGAEATAAIGIVSSSTWLLHGILVGLFTSFAIQIAQYLGADRQDDARGVLRQSMIFNILLGCGMAALGIGICRFLPGWPVFAGQCFGLLWHLVRSPAVQHGHGDVFRHAAGHG